MKKTVHRAASPKKVKNTLDEEVSPPWWNKLITKYTPYIPYVVFFISFMSMIISLYFSEIAKLPPCTLCWYQRIAMYPIVTVSIVGILLKDKKLPTYVLPLSIIGLLLAIYHNLLVWGIVSEALAPCTAGVPCNKQDFVLYGFITIPLLSMISFAIISGLMLIYAKGFKKNVKRS